MSELNLVSRLAASTRLSEIKLTNNEIGQEDGVMNWPLGESIKGPASPSTTN